MEVEGSLRLSLGFNTSAQVLPRVVSPPPGAKTPKLAISGTPWVASGQQSCEHKTTRGLCKAGKGVQGAAPPPQGGRWVPGCLMVLMKQPTEWRGWGSGGQGFPHKGPVCRVGCDWGQEGG